MLVLGKGKGAIVTIKGMLMGNKLAIAFFTVGIMCPCFAQIFTWTDGQGVVHFSDTPHQGAQPVALPNVQSFSTPSSPSPSNNEAPPNAVGNPVEPEHVYKKLAITQPSNEATIRNNQGFVMITAAVEPDLFPDDNFQLIFDGEVLGKPQPIPVFQISGINRGAHSFAIQVVNKQGEVLITSENITVFMHNPRAGMVKNAGG